MKRIITSLKEKWPVYFLEILVVTIGILGAYALNNWNENINNQREHSEMLKNLKSEYVINKNELEGRITRTALIVEKSNQLLKLMTPDYESLDAKQIDILILHTTISQTYDGSYGALQDVINNNKITLIKNDSLRVNLVSWFQKVDNVKDVETRVFKVLQDHLTPYLYKNTSFQKMDENNGDDLVPVSKLSFDNRKVMADVEFESLINNCFWKNHELLDSYKDMKKDLLLILKLIDKEQAD